MMIRISAWKQTTVKYMWTSIQTCQVISWKNKQKNNKWRVILGILPHSLVDNLSQQHQRLGETLPILPVEKDEGDALFKVWAHEPLKGLFMPLPAWIITPSSPVMCCGWYIGPHLLLLCFHLGRSSKSSINKKTQACNKISAQPKTTGLDPPLGLHDLFGKNYRHGQLPFCL